MEFEEVDYWNELQEIMDWTSAHVTSTILSVLGCTGESLSLSMDLRNASLTTRCSDCSGTKS